MPKSQTFLTYCIIASFILMGSACSTNHFPWIYRIDVDQGNIVDKKKLEQVKIGMTTRQVEYLLGTPVLGDTFRPNVWNYFYSYETGKGVISQTDVTLNFKGDKLVSIHKKPYTTLKRNFY